MCRMIGLLFLFLLFFFLTYGYTRDLHSFPTRRSSDLRLRRVAGMAGDVDQPFAEHAAAFTAQGADEEAGGPLLFQDRKSTRLNSSHRCISYAVFCLKKKKKPDIHSY